MFGEYELREVALMITSERRRVETFLQRNDLRLDTLDTYVGIYDSADELVGGGGLCENIIKCVAISSALRSSSLTNTLVSRLREIAFAKGYTNVFVFTKPENEAIFSSLAFHTVGRSSRALLLESDPRGISSYTERLKRHSHEGQNGVIVMNANPLTMGHLYLIETAAARVEHLFIIVVSEDKSAFTYKERRDMIAEAVRELPSVSLIEGGNYIISAATFPSYFIKEPSEAALAQIELDIDIFNRHIAPALNATVRFVGSEPLDALTRLYNERLKALLHIEVVEIPRLEKHGEVVSASLVRRYIAENKAAEALHIVPKTTAPYILSHSAALSLQQELDLTPKPGLVDRHDTGAHRDMNCALMERSIRVLTPYFTELAMLGLRDKEPSIHDIMAIGVRAEDAMLATTNGVNTHRGALFSVGLTVVAAANCLRERGEITDIALQTTIKRLASGFPQAAQTHGGEVRKRYNVGGAVALAQSGYTPLFVEWLPFHRANTPCTENRLRLLLLIMSRLDDTNIYYRCGKEVADNVRRLSKRLFEEFSMQALEAVNDNFIRLNISPGGAADMLALTLFVASVSHDDNKTITINTNNIKQTDL